MKLNAPKNVNYAATVVRIRTIRELPGLDNLVAVPLLGYQALVSKDTQPGELGLLFGPETQLSTEYTSANNLFRHAELNIDPNATGYLEDNRRVKAIRLRGHVSNALFMPLASLDYLLKDSTVSQLKEGDTFDEIDGREICRKYVIRERRAGHYQVAKVRESRVDELMFPQHFDTANYFRVADTIPLNVPIQVTQKLHGTSVRIGHVPVARRLTWRDKLARLLGAKVTATEWAYVYGSRKVVKDPDNPEASAGWYGQDLYSQVGARLKNLLPKGTVVYGEIVGWVPGTNTPIQQGYTYRIPEGEARLYVYRITTINEDGRAVDLSWPAVKEFCAGLGINTVPELGVFDFLDPDLVTAHFLDQRLADIFPGVLPTDGTKVDEGVCLRVEGITPTVVKAKSPKFLEHETKLLDRGVADLESVDA